MKKLIIIAIVLLMTSSLSVVAQTNPTSIVATRAGDAISFTCIGGTPGAYSWYQADTDTTMEVNPVTGQPVWGKSNSVGLTEVTGPFTGATISGLNPNLKYFIHVATTATTEGVCLTPVSTSVGCAPVSQSGPSIGGTIDGPSSITYGNSISLTLFNNTGSIVWWERKINDGDWSVISNTGNQLSLTEKPNSTGTFSYRVKVQNGTNLAVYSSDFGVAVDARQLIISAKPATKNYDGLTYSFSVNDCNFTGFAPGEDPSLLTGLSFSGPGVTATNVGSYTFTPFGVVLNNYIVAYVSNTLIITLPSSVTVLNTLDDGPGSLRKAIANISNGGTITFCSSIDGQTITLASSLIIDKNIIINNFNHKTGLTISGTGYNVTINAGKVLTLGTGAKFTIPTIQNNAGTSGLVIESGAVLIQNTVDLPATVKKTLNSGWHLFGSPSKQGIGNTLSSITPIGGSTQLKPYTNGTNWQANITSPLYFLQPTVGYAVCPSVSFTGCITGNLTYQSMPDISVSLIYNGTLPTQSWNLVSNPFTSYVDWRLVGKTSVSSTLYYWDNSLQVGPPATNTTYFRTYNSVNGVGVPAGTRPYIAPLQGFFVRATYTSPRISFPNSARTTCYNDFFKESTNTQILVRLKTETNMGYDELAICKNPDASLNYEEFDSEKMFDGLPVGMFSLAPSGEKLVINTISDTNTIIPISIMGSTGDKATITAFDLESNIPVYLEDRLKGKIISLSENSSYEFDFPTDEVNGRFFIRFKDNSISSSESSINIFQTSQQLNIVAQTGEEIQSVEVYSLTGACVYKAQVSGSNVFTKTLQFSPAIYLVKVGTSLSTKTTKLNW